MKFSRVRYFSRVFVILLSCCGTVVFGSTSTTAAPDSFGLVQLSPPNSPPARSYLAMTYDAASGKIIVFGGFDGEYLNDTWAFDGVSWTQIATSVAPSPRTNAQMAYDSVTHKVVLYGGYNGTSYLGDTWLWDGATSQWAPVRTAHRPPALTGPMVFADPNGHADLYGGFDGQFYQLKMFQWTGSYWMPLSPATVPYARSSAAVATNTSTRKVVLFGGLADVNPVNTWTYDGTTWTLETRYVQPPWVNGGSAAFDPKLQAVVLFGGGSGGVDQNSTWQWLGVRGIWKQLRINQSPPPREGAGMTYFPALGHVIVFGGQNNDTPLNDTWELIP